MSLYRYTTIPLKLRELFDALLRLVKCFVVAHGLFLYVGIIPFHPGGLL